MGGAMVDVAAFEAWQAVLGDLQVQVARPIYQTWLKGTEGVALNDDFLTVAVPTSFTVEWLERRMSQLIHKTAQKVTDRALEVRFQVRPSAEETGGVGGPEVEDPPMTGNPLRGPGQQLNPSYTFGSFVVGPSNRLPYSAARAVAEAPRRSYNPLFIYSGVGLGKTHLLHAIGNTCVSRGLKTLYVTSEQFTNEFIGAIRTRTTEEFRSRYRGVEVLLMDDIQFISGKEQTQEGFFHTFNELHNSNRQVVLASDRPPRSLSLLEDRLRSRFEWGLIADIQPPDLETRIAILRNKADQMALAVEDSIIEFVAKKVQRNVRELEGSLNRVAALAHLTGRPITMDLATQAVGDFISTPARHAVGPQRIIDEVTTRFRVTNQDVVGKSRKKHIVRARHVAMYLLREELGMKDSEIGRLLGGRNHSTVIHAVEKMNYEVNVDAGLREDVLAVKEALFS